MKALVVASGLFALLCGGSANAALIQVDLSYDLDTYVVGGTWQNTLTFFDSPVTVENNDRVQFNVSFETDQALIWDGNGLFNAWFGSSSVGTFNWSNTSLVFNGLVGGSQWGNPIADGSSGAAHIGPTYVINGDGVVREFHGFTLEYDVEYANGAASHTFEWQNWVPLIGGNGLTATAASTVPEPTSMALLGIGVLGMVAARRRKGLNK